jgi:DNA polymerase III alpha subunit
MDIEAFLVDHCPEQNYDRLLQEIELYRNHNLIPVLRAMKYVVDTLRSNNIVWGVGRGSSVASYVLFIIGVHKIDSVKYKLPINEFFKGE